MLTWLYVPGDRPDRFAKAVDSGADAVILDLEDAVLPDRKDYAREAVAEFCAQTHAVPVHVRIGSDADLPVLNKAPGVAGLRLPKVAAAEQVARVAESVHSGLELHCLIESALGVERAYEIATAHPRVAGIGLGESDLRSALGVTDDAGLAYPRGRIVVAARAAGLPAPAMSVYPNVADEAGLIASSRAGRALGFVGRAAVHPRQLPGIVAAFRPTAAELAAARELLDAVSSAADRGTGAVLLPDGRFADRAMVGNAERVVALAERYPPTD